MTDINLHDVVAITEDIKAPKFMEDSELLLCKGLVGTVVEILSNGKAYEVEFAHDSKGQTYAMIPIEPDKLSVLWRGSVELDLAEQHTVSFISAHH